MRLSKIISFVFHPALMPTYAFLLAVNFLPMLSDLTSNKQKIDLLRIVFIFTFLIPVISVIVLKKIKIVSSYYIENKSERKLPLLIAIISYYVLLLFFQEQSSLGFYYNKFLVSTLLNQLLLGALLILIFSFIISNFWKISLHMLGIGGVVGAFFALHSPDTLFLILLLLWCSGLVAYARINENAHTCNQVYAGFLAGVCIEFFIFYF